VFAKAREKARQTACLNNQKQITTAALMYAQDNNEMLPEASNFWGAINIDKGVLKCPTKSRLANGYVYYSAIAGQALGKITAPETTALTGDGVHPATTSPATFDNVAYSDADFEMTRHGGKYIVSFADGHQEMTGTSVFGNAAIFALNENTGTSVSDTSGKGGSGTFYNSPTWSASGHSGACVKFDGNNSYIEIPNSTTLENIQEGNYTLAAWFKPNTVPAGSGSANNACYGIIMKQGYHTGLKMNASGTLAMDHWLTGPTSTGVSSASTFTAGTWYHVVGVVDRTNGTNKIYVNGVLEGTTSFAKNAVANENNQTPWRIGIAQPGAGTYRWCADAWIDDARIYNRALNDAEIAALAAQ
jgi:prepilin-type processing-associated H-X9-DG protein